MARKKDYFEVKVMVSVNHQVNTIHQVVAVDTAHAHTTDATVAMLCGILAENLPSIIEGNHHLISHRSRPVQTKVSCIVERKEYGTYGK
jgi:hypothetical protein